MPEDLKQLLLKSSDAVETAPPHMKSAARSIRVMLIQPPATGAVRSLLPQVDNEGGEGIGYKPPLGILYVASMVAASSSHDVRVIDAQAMGLGIDDIVEEAARFQPELIGISAWTDFWYPAFELGRRLKQAIPNMHLCYGGPHVGIYSAETLAVSHADSVVVGDGEVPFLHLCNMIANHTLDNGFPGLHLADAGLKPAPALFYIHNDLDALPHPDRTLLPINIYGSVLAKGNLVTTMITSRGCPHQCTFCKLNFQKTVVRSAASVVEEFQKIHALGIREVEIYDDTFTWSRKRLREICEGLIEADLQIEWAVRDRVSSSALGDGLLALMYKAGCRRIHFGIESGSEAVIKLMKKRITTKQATEAVRLAKRAGLTVLTYFMFGNDGETVEDMNLTIDFAIALDADYAQFSITIPYAGTELYLKALEDGTISRDYWLDYAKNPTPDFTPPEIIEREATLETLLKIRDKAVRHFYFRPRYLLRQIGKLRSHGEFLRKARMGIQLAQSVYTK